MPTARVTLHLPGRTVPATLSTDHSASSYGQPVLILDDPGPSYAEGEDVPHGPADMTRHGVAACLLLTAEDDAQPAEGGEEGPDGARALLERWHDAASGYRARTGLPSLAEAWAVGLGGWADGSTIERPAESADDGPRNLVSELHAAAPAVEHVPALHHVTGNDEAPAEVDAFAFPDGSGVVVWNLATHGGNVGGNRHLVATWSTFDSEGRTDAGRVVLPVDDKPAGADR